MNPTAPDSSPSTQSVLPVTRHLIVNADDFGLSDGVNQGIIQCHERGIVTSASLMVLKSAAAGAAQYGRSRPTLSVGLHLDFGEWSFLDGEWRVLYEVVPMSDAAAVEKEVHHQLELFRAMMGCDPTHLDSHQHMHRDEPLRSIVLRAAARMNIPVRSFDPSVRYCGDFYGQGDKGYAYHEGISVEALLALLRNLGPGVTELGCHPGKGDEPTSMYNRERHLECEALCNPRVREAIKELRICLCSFRDDPVRQRQHF